MKKYIYKLLKHLFCVRYGSLDHKLFRAYVTNFYDNYNPEHSFNSYRITKIRIYDFPRKIVIEINSLSPGMIIGVRGNTIDRFKNFMQSKYKKPLSVKLEESNPFR